MPNSPTAFALVESAAKCFATCLSSPAVAEEPVARAVGVGHGFLGSESLGRHQEQSRFRIHVLQHFGDMGAIDVRDKVHVEVVLYGRSASVTMKGPRSEPPIPMLTTSVIGLPV